MSQEEPEGRQPKAERLRRKQDSNTRHPARDRSPKASRRRRRFSGTVGEWTQLLRLVYDICRDLKDLVE